MQDWNVMDLIRLVFEGLKHGEHWPLHFFTVLASQSIFFLLKVYFESLIITTATACLQLKQP